MTTPCPAARWLNRREPQRGQNSRVTGSPDPPGAVYFVVVPVTFIASIGKAAIVEWPAPLAFWQSVHEQWPAKRGALSASKRISPHWQPPEYFAMLCSISRPAAESTPKHGRRKWPSADARENIWLTPAR